MKPEQATHYSRAMNSYFHFDCACFIWSEELYQWLEYTAIGHIEDLEELK